jgi:hypothetical protein
MVETHPRSWTPTEDELFRKLVEYDAPAEVIAAKLNRPISALKMRGYAIGLPLKWFRPKAIAKY